MTGYGPLISLPCLLCILYKKLKKISDIHIFPLQQQEYNLLKIHKILAEVAEQVTTIWRTAHNSLVEQLTTIWKTDHDYLENRSQLSG
jgi:hypothetical protein